MGRVRPLDQAALVITVDLEPAAHRSNVQEARRLDEVTEWLVAIVNDLDMVATWAVADPAHSAATELLASGQANHELALLGDASWVGPAAGRGRFAKELFRRVSGSRGADLTVSSLVSRNVDVAQHIDLLVKHNITAITGLPSSEELKRPLSPPRVVCYGLWEMPVAARLPGQGNWRHRLVYASAIRRGIHHAAREFQVFHLRIDAWRLSQSTRSERRVVQRALGYIARAVERRGAYCLTLGQLAAQLSQVPSITPARSILRSAG